MSFLEELENNKNKQDSQKTPRQLWESCFKYFNHFISILNKNKDEFEVDFNFTPLNSQRKCIVMGPYEITRSQQENELKFELTFTTHIEKTIRIKAKDNRHAELLQNKLAKDGLLSRINTDAKSTPILELNPSIKSHFKITLNPSNEFSIDYSNVCTSNSRTLKLSLENINEAYMDKLARYILGQNSELYTESISDQEITKIRKKIETEKKLKAQREAEIQAEIKREQELEEIRKANTLKEKSKKYFFTQTEKIKSKLMEKINNIKK